MVSYYNYNMKINKRLVKVGSSLGFILDKPICKKVGLKKGDWVEISLRKV